MKKQNIAKHSKTDWNRIDTMRDKDIDYSDIPELNDSFFKKAILRMPEPKITITIRMDRNVLEWFKSKGRGYQTRINALLLAYMKAHQSYKKRS